MTQFAMTLVRRPTMLFFTVHPGLIWHPSPIMALLILQPCTRRAGAPSHAHA